MPCPLYSISQMRHLKVVGIPQLSAAVLSGPVAFSRSRPIQGTVHATSTSFLLSLLLMFICQ